MATVYCNKAERVQKFLGIKGSQAAFADIKFRKDDDGNYTDDAVLLRKTLKYLLNATPNPNNGERIAKPIFEFGRVLIKMSKNTVKYALSECDVYVSNYTYEATNEKRVQILIAPPANNDEFMDEDIDDFDDIINTKPSGALADDIADDTDDEDDNDVEETPASKKSRKK